MDSDLIIEADWEKLNSGPPEERAAFAAIGIRFNKIWLTEAEDTFVNRIRPKVHLSAYHLAEWFAWNWWRLRWEPRRHTPDWLSAHRMSTIGKGYVWPNITIFSDGERVVLDTERTMSTPSEPLRYLCQIAAIVRAPTFENSLHTFIEKVIGQLREEDIRGSNLELVWKDVLSERSDPDIARRRKFEALLGWDVDEADDSIIEQLVADSLKLGEGGAQELAAAVRSVGAAPVTSAELFEIAKTAGFVSKPRDGVTLRDKSEDALPINVAAWKRGVAAAKALREQERLGGEPILNSRLCEFLGVEKSVVESQKKLDSFSFALDEGSLKSAIVLRSRYETGRRFDLARLLGDRLASISSSPLKLATRTYTYRQKLQRSFAGEFLCPFDALSELLKGDFSDEAIQDAASHFNVSVLTVRTLLVNHRLIERESLNDDFDFAA